VEHFACALMLVTGKQKSTCPVQHILHKLEQAQTEQTG